MDFVSGLLKTDADAQESMLKRASKGKDLAALSMRGKAPFSVDQETKTYSTLTLSSLRAGRGIGKGSDLRRWRRKDIYSGQRYEERIFSRITSVE